MSESEETSGEQVPVYAAPIGTPLPMGGGAWPEEWIPIGYTDGGYAFDENGVTVDGPGELFIHRTDERAE